MPVLPLWVFVACSRVNFALSFIYIYIYIYTHTHTHIYIYIERERDRQREIERNAYLKCWNKLQERVPSPKQWKFTSTYVNKQVVFEVQPPRSPDLSPLYFYLWRRLKPLVYSASIENEQTLHQRIFDVCQIIHHRTRTFETVQQYMIRRVHACTDSGGTYLSICCELRLDI